jgi:hypothetical protein
MGRLLGTLLFGATSTDPLTLTVVVVVFVSAEILGVGTL